MGNCAIKNLNPGNKFVYGKKSAIVLDKMDDGILCMVLDEDYQSEFDEDSNNFSESTLRTKLDNSYMRQWIDKGANLSDFAEMEVDLTAEDGLDDYGSCRCYLAPKTCDQHRKYRKLIPNSGCWEWTATSYSVKSNGDSSRVRNVYSDGSLGFNTAANTQLVRPLFKLKSDTLVKADSVDDIEKKADSPIDTMRKLVGELGIPTVMEILTKVIAEQEESR